MLLLVCVRCAESESRAQVIGPAQNVQRGSAGPRMLPTTATERHQESLWMVSHSVRSAAKNPPAYGYAVCERCLELCRSALDKTPTHNGKSLDTGFARALRADYLLNKKEKK